MKMNFLFLPLCALFVVGCGSGGESSTSGLSYYESIGKCYDKANNLVDSKKCDNLKYVFNYSSCMDANYKRSTDLENCTKLVGKYFYIGATCYEKDDNDLKSVDVSLCASTQTPVDCNNKSYSTTTLGGFFSYSANCKLFNCSGRTLIDMNTRTYVICK